MDGAAARDARLDGRDEEDVGSLKGVRLGIKYQDNKYDVGHYFIVVENAVRRMGSTSLRAYCEPRGDIRAFRIDRIIEIVDPRTGEVHEEPPVFLAELIRIAEARSGRRRKPVNQSKETQEDATARLIAEAEDGLIALLFFAHADEALHPAEAALLWRYLDWQKERCGIAGKVNKTTLDVWMAATVPDTQQFADALDKLLRGDQADARYVLALIPQIVMADGEASEVETGRLKGLMALLNQPLPSRL
ncbi:hypothetical protein V6C03_12230 [Methyloligella sp. 2.7D]|uniref:hypothetical protein n=1 Tax=unclassified Methyloligella TaxID=2625955 RepID=UPI00157DD627|nr:hypothetical protein [Methyloligella sp. GL2]QKP77438.1 hypothetical protein HT051_08230 [Methyloligella sp. GL2]